jgi:MoaA/NifB/PqqE/SkfB family radical SAM enzyme
MRDLVPPAVCDVSVTNVCNAACDFCGFARDKTLAGPARYIHADAFARALPILYRRGIRYMTLQGGEPLVHPEIVRLVSDTTAAGMSCAIITNGWFLSRYIGSLAAAAGLDRLIISIDSADLAEHERNRGLEGLESRMTDGMAQARALGVPVQASVTVNRLVRYYDLPDTLRRLGYRNASMLMHAAVAATDAARELAAGRIGSAVSSLFRRSVAQSLWALIEEAPKMRRLARQRKQTVTAGHVEAG